MLIQGEEPGSKGSGSLRFLTNISIFTEEHKCRSNGTKRKPQPTLKSMAYHSTKPRQYCRICELLNFPISSIRHSKSVGSRLDIQTPEGFLWFVIPNHMEQFGS